MPVIVLGSVENCGALLAVRRERSYAGKSEATHKALYRIHYAAYFYNCNSKPVGYLSDNKPYTTWMQTKSITELRRYLSKRGYNEFTIEDVT